MGGLVDRPAQLVAAQGPDEHLSSAEEARKLRVGGAAAVEVSAHGEDHERASPRVADGLHEGVDERFALPVVAAGGEGLLELVDGDHQASPRMRVGPRLL